jgi:REP element-mobilizing transposase RayT
MPINYDPDKHARRSIRLRGYDYTHRGAYAVTLCIYQRECILGVVASGKAISNELGRLVKACWEEIPVHFPNTDLDMFVVMPNHVHGIIVLRDSLNTGMKQGTTPHAESFGRPVSGSLPTIIRSFKSATTRRVNETRNIPNMPVWQRNYYEHIIRNEDALHRMREYIALNPLRWHEDAENPQHR